MGIPRTNDDLNSVLPTSIRAIVMKSSDSYNELNCWLWFTEGFETVDLREAKALLDELS